MINQGFPDPNLCFITDTCSYNRFGFLELSLASNKCWLNSFINSFSDEHLTLCVIEKEVKP
jgi:hypothetical protein